MSYCCCPPFPYCPMSINISEQEDDNNNNNMEILYSWGIKLAAGPWLDRECKGMAQAGSAEPAATEVGPYSGSGTELCLGSSIDLGPSSNRELHSGSSVEPCLGSIMGPPQVCGGTGLHLGNSTGPGGCCRWHVHWCWRLLNSVAGHSSSNFWYSARLLAGWIWSVSYMFDTHIVH